MRATGIGAITAAVVQRLLATPAVTTQVGQRVFDRAPAGTVRPYLRVRVRNERANDTLGAAGVDAVLEVIVVSDYLGDSETGDIATAVRSCLEGVSNRLTLDGFSRPADVTEYQGLDAFEQTVGGVTVTYRPLWFRVQVQ